MIADSLHHTFHDRGWEAFMLVEADEEDGWWLSVLWRLGSCWIWIKSGDEIEVLA